MESPISVIIAGFGRTLIFQIKSIYIDICGKIVTRRLRHAQKFTIAETDFMTVLLNLHVFKSSYFLYASIHLSVYCMSVVCC